MKDRILGRSEMKKLGLSRLSMVSSILVMAVVLFVPTGRLSARTQNEVKNEARLQEILRITGEYCERVKKMALFYICQENIIDIENFFRGVSPALGMQKEERIFNLRRVKRQTYRYDYQLIKKGDDFLEQRILLEKNGKKKLQENVNLSHLKYYSQYLIFGPVGFLSQSWQNHFTYSLIGEDMINGEPATIIQADPKESRLDNYSFGRIWINKNFQIVRVEWEPASIQNYEDEILISRLGPFHKKVVWIADYTVEKNGVRFPSRQFVQEIFFRNSPDGFQQKAVKRETRFDYTEYKFFIVETDIKFRKDK